MIKPELLCHFPCWFQFLDTKPDSYYLVLSDDMDSFYSCRLLHKVFGLKIGGFYQFGAGLFLTKYASGKTPIYVDIAIASDGNMAFDNHRNLMTNHMMVNPNLITDRKDDAAYYLKYPGSTLLLLVALFEDKINGGLTEIEKTIALCADSFYRGYFSKDDRFKRINIDWLNLLGLSSYETILQNHSKKYFDDFSADFHLNEKIYMSKNGTLYTYADILPQDKFQLAIPTMTKIVKKSEVENMKICNDIFTAAETYKGNYILNILKR